MHWLVLLVGSAGMLTLWLALDRAETRRLQFETQLTADQLSLRLEAFIEARTALVSSLASERLVSQVDVDTRFVEEAERLTRLFPGLQALNFVSPEGAIQVVVPQMDNQEALGKQLDDHPDPVVAAAFRRARDTGVVASTPLIDLFQGGKGFATYTPIHSVEGTGLGFVDAVFRVDRLMDLALAEPELRERFNFRVIAGDGRTAYTHQPDGIVTAEADVHASAPVRFAGRPWRLEIAPTDAYAAAHRTQADELLALTGFALLLGFVFLLRVREQRRAQLAESRRRYRMIVENQTDVIVSFNRAGRVTYASATLCELLDRTEPELMDQPFWPTVGGDPAAPPTMGEDRDEVVMELNTRAGLRWMAWSISPPDDVGDTVAVGRDITGRRALETQLLQSQKMQAVGRLAGGVAHDFNNLLQAMMGHLVFALEELPPASPIRDDLIVVQTAAERAADLTRQLLAFSRQQVLARKVVDVNVVTASMLRMLPRMLDASVSLKAKLWPKPLPVLADPGQLDQILMNLCVNARDALGEGGRITVSTHRRELTAPRGQALPPGSYVTLVVEDDGAGMSADVRARIFEPFFTTKGVGAGTGLGLATVYGIARQHDGHIEVDSEPGEGCRFTVWLPASALPVDSTAGLRPQPDHRRGATVLVAEDDDAVRQSTTRTLEGAGYHVIQANNGADALVRFDGAARIDAAVLDVAMPKMGGYAVARALRLRSPRLPLLFVSGYAEPELEADAAVPPGPHLTKPFNGAALLDSLAALLGDAPA